ncbi:SMI1/KNR4 family protein [Calycomorphotria hydatis]|uniref:SMI1 / KNR4 family protein n=1 Tax=Calycomorphotria hydatis TaxID=2528027 RepID=A0A517TA45_9PLAN|nr:SMI1/KNR4 family protein [Calycomorphotria hydatis]QDT65251.1 SMI1 / KNR4 family protein [Calycomorphotria hydatis]
MYWDQVRSRLIQSGLASKNDIIGCSEGDLASLEQRVGLTLPSSYKEFMREFGRGAGKFFDDVCIYYDEIANLQYEASEILYDYPEHNLLLSTSTFVFSMRQGEQFTFFNCLEEDPPVWFYFEGHPAFERIADCFVDFLEAELRQAEDMYSKIRGTEFDF